MNPIVSRPLGGNTSTIVVLRRLARKVDLILEFQPVLELGKSESREIVFVYVLELCYNITNSPSPIKPTKEVKEPITRQDLNPQHKITSLNQMSYRALWKIVFLYDFHGGCWLHDHNYQVHLPSSPYTKLNYLDNCPMNFVCVGYLDSGCGDRKTSRYYSWEGKTKNSRTQLYSIIFRYL